MNQMQYRNAEPADCAMLAELNHQLIQDEGHRNQMSVAELEQRMRGWLVGEYAALILRSVVGLLPMPCIASRLGRSICGSCLWYETGGGRELVVRRSRFCGRKFGRMEND